MCEIMLVTSVSVRQDLNHLVDVPLNYIFHLRNANLLLRRYIYLDYGEVLFTVFILGFESLKKL